MRPWPPFLTRVRRDRRAATTVEYCLIIAFIVLAMLAGFQAVGTTTSGMWNNVSNTVAAAH